MGSKLLFWLAMPVSTTAAAAVAAGNEPIFAAIDLGIVLNILKRCIVVLPILIMIAIYLIRVSIEKSHDVSAPTEVRTNLSNITDVGNT